MATTPGNALLLRQINTNLVQNTLKSARKATKSQLAELTGLTSVTVGTVLHELLLSGVVQEGELIPSMGGRPSREYLFNPDYANVVCIYAIEQDGKPIFHILVANLFGETIYEEAQSLNQPMIFDFYLILDNIFSKFPLIRAIGFSFSGTFYDEKLNSHYVNLNGEGFLETFRQKYDVPVIFENDVNAASIGFCENNHVEAKTPILYLTARDQKPPAFALYLNGEIYRGYRNQAGEIPPSLFEIPWNDPSFFEDKEKFAPFYAKFLAQMSCVVTPAKIILNGTIFTEEALRELTREFSRLSNQSARPSLSGSASFQADLASGICSLTIQSLGNS